MAHLGVNVYYWGELAQRRFLVDGLGPVAGRARRKGLAETFWYTSFDSRGPHLFAVFETGDATTLEAWLQHQLTAQLELLPSPVVLTVAELEERHRFCRGKVLCRVDSEVGFGANNTLRIFDHPAGGYPFRSARAIHDPERFWRYMDRLAFWTLDRLAEGRTVVDAVRFAATVDQALETSPLDPEAVWRHHASTLLLTLNDRLGNDAAAVIDTLPTAIGPRNYEIFDRLWQLGAEGNRFPAIDELVAAATRGDGRSIDERRALVREIVHVTLLQLGLLVRSHIPLVLFAWHRKLGGRMK